MSDISNGHHSHLFTTAGLLSYISMLYQFAKLFELFIRRLVSPKCVVAGIYVRYDIFGHQQNFQTQNSFENK